MITAPLLTSRIGDWCVLEVITLSDHQCIEFSIQERSHSVKVERGGKVRSPSWNTKWLSKDKLLEHHEETRLIDELGWAGSAGSLEDTVRAVRRKVVAACDHSMPCHGHGRTGDSMYWWNDQLSVLRRKCLTARQRFTRSKGDPLLREAWKKAKSALRQGIKKSRLHCWKDLIGEVEKDPWGLAFKIVTERLVTRRKTPGLDTADRVKYIVRSLFPHVEPFQRQDQSSCAVRCEELFTLEELKRAGGRLKAKTAPRIDGVPNRILKKVIDPPVSLQLLSSGLHSHGRREQSLENQFAFRKGRSTGDAIQAVVDIATKARRETGKRKGSCALISIDIRNAFSTARWNICIKAMVRKKVFQTICCEW